MHVDHVMCDSELLTRLAAALIQQLTAPLLHSDDDQCDHTSHHASMSASSNSISTESAYPNMRILVQVALKQFWVEAERPPPSSLQAYFHDSQVLISHPQHDGPGAVPLPQSSSVSTAESGNSSLW